MKKAVSAKKKALGTMKQPVQVLTVPKPEPDQTPCEVEGFIAGTGLSKGSLIQSRLDALYSAMAPLGLKEKTSWEIAFAVAEISPELTEMLSIISKTERGELITETDLVSLQRMACHWPDHLRDLMKYLVKAFGEIEARELAQE